jgi:hypothetical protein
MGGSLGIPASPPVSVDAVLKINRGEQPHVLAAGQAPRGDDLLQNQQISGSARSDLPQLPRRSGEKP